MNVQTQPAESRSLVAEMATKYALEPKMFMNTLRATIVPKEISNEELAAFLHIANKYDLNPFLREIYAFPKKGGGIQTIVSVDGWCNLINSHPQFDGAEFTEHHDKGGKVTGMTCRIWRKDRERAIAITEYLSECSRGTDVWKQWPLRMLRHRALIQCARYAFGFAGLLDPDESDHQPMRDVTPRDGRDLGPPLPEEAAKEHVEKPASSQSTHPEPETEKGAPAAGGTPDTPAGERGAPTPTEDAVTSSLYENESAGELFENAVALATQRGWDAHKAGAVRKAMPGEYRDQKRAEEADAWLLGWDRFAEANKGAGGTGGERGARC
jgi:phage recombination protein Bet